MDRKANKFLFILKGKKPVSAKNVVEWAEWYDGKGRRERRVRSTTLLDGKYVSTIFLGVYDFDGYFFETMIFTDRKTMKPVATYKARTWEEAEAVHQMTVIENKVKIPLKESYRYFWLLVTRFIPLQAWVCFVIARYYLRRFWYPLKKKSRNLLRDSSQILIDSTKSFASKIQKVIKTLMHNKK